MDDALAPKVKIEDDPVDVFGWAAGCEEPEPNWNDVEEVEPPKVGAAEPAPKWNMPPEGAGVLPGVAEPLPPLLNAKGLLKDWSLFPVPAVNENEVLPRPCPLG